VRLDRKTGLSGAVHMIGRFVLRLEDTGEITFVKEPMHEDVCELLG
jgi:hypothetical protein